MKLLFYITSIILFLTGCTNLNLSTPQKTPNKQALIKEAEEGNISSMIELNKYYLFPQTKEGYDYYDKWYSKVIESKNPSDINAFASIFKNYRRMFINGDIRMEKLYIASANLGDKESLFKLLENYQVGDTKKKREETEKRILDRVNKYDYLKLYDFYTSNYRKKKAKNIFTLIKNQSNDFDDIKILIEAKETENKELYNKLLESNDKIILSNLANFLLEKRNYNQALAFYQKLLKDDYNNIENNLNLLEIYKKLYKGNNKNYKKFVIPQLEKLTNLDNEKGAAELLQYFKYSEDKINYKDLDNQFKNLNDAKIQLAIFYLFNKEKDKGLQILDDIASLGNQKAIIMLARYEESKYEPSRNGEQLAKKWQKYILNSNNYPLIIKFDEMINSSKYTDKQLYDVKVLLAKKSIEDKNIIVMRRLYKLKKEEEPELAKIYLNLAVEWGDVLSTNILIKALSYDTNMEESKKFMQLNEQLAEKGEVYALIDLARYYLNSKKILSIKKDVNKALEYYEKASKEGSLLATKELARLYLCGNCEDTNENTINYTKAKFYQEKLAKEEDDEEAYFNLAWMYEEGKGVQTNYDKAIEYYEKAAKLDYSTAYYNIAWIYFDTKLKDYKKAAEYLEKCSSMNNVKCISFLGEFNLQGYGIKKDIEKAKTYFMKVAKVDNNAALNLGEIYYNEKDYINALKYNKIAYETSKDKDAALLIYKIYNSGNKDVKKDIKLAKMWHQLSK